MVSIFRINTLTPGDNLSDVATVMSQLRPAYTPEGLIEQIKRQQTQGYYLATVEDDDSVLCVAGFRFGENLAWGKHLYVDDLVTAAQERSRGAGKFMLDWLIDHAKTNGCVSLHLDSGVQRFAAHRFYLRAGFTISSHHFALALSDSTP